MFHRLNSESVKALGVSVPQLTTLFHVMKHESARPGDIARALSIDAGAATRLVARLRDKGLVAMRADAHDLRVKHVELTASGEEVARRGLVAVGEANRLLTEPFTAEELDVVERFLAHTIDLSTGGIFAWPPHP